MFTRSNQLQKERSGVEVSEHIKIFHTLWKLFIVYICYRCFSIHDILIFSLKYKISLIKYSFPSIKKNSLTHFPVDTPRRFNVDMTSCDIARRRINVETTSSVYWVHITGLFLYPRRVWEDNNATKWVDSICFQLHQSKKLTLFLEWITLFSKTGNIENRFLEV